MAPTRPTTIRLPDSPKLRGRLAAKTKEYERRVPNGIISTDDVLTTCKYILLMFILESPDGTVNTDRILWALKQSPIAAEIIENPSIFDSACLVIDHYCHGRFDQIIGGTSLPDPEET